MASKSVPVMKKRIPLKCLTVLLVLTTFIHTTVAQSTEISYLSGTGSDHTVNWQFYCTAGSNAGKWTTIGTKTQRNETTGPMGMKNIFYDYEKEPERALLIVLYFDFSGK